jgi:hypothetical protein
MNSLIFNTLFNNWKTTLAGIVGAVVTLAGTFGFHVPADVQTGIIAVALFVIGFFAKDADTTGN